MSDVGIDGFAGAEIIGRGAFGSVYRATQADLERLVALKVFQGAPDDQRRRTPTSSTDLAPEPPCRWEYRRRREENVI